MIQNVHKISVDSPELRAHFQQEILDHWRDLKGDKKIPCKQGFRPQKFPRFLAQLAIISVNEHGSFSDRLTGGTICDVLKLSSGLKKLTEVPDLKIRESIDHMLREAKDEAEPMYYTGRFLPPARPPVDFSVLIIPFSKFEGADQPCSLLLAFDFTKHATSNLLRHPII
tara:strand:+ start:1406 stop:1912 length:507 start_codon:yes stop_codon:yes gene_type:complete